MQPNQPHLHNRIGIPFAVTAARVIFVSPAGLVLAWLLALSARRYEDRYEARMYFSLAILAALILVFELALIAGNSSGPIVHPHFPPGMHPPGVPTS